MGTMHRNVIKCYMIQLHKCDQYSQKHVVLQEQNYKVNEPLLTDGIALPTRNYFVAKKGSPVVLPLQRNTMIFL